MLLLNLICTVALTAQVQQCEVWQWTGTDSANKVLARTNMLNEHGLIVKSVYTGYRLDSYEIPDQVNFLVYRDTFAMTWTSSIPDGDSLRIQYEYDEEGLRVQKNEYRFRHVVPDTGRTGMFTFTDATPDTTEGKWSVVTKGTYTYDRWGRKALFISIDAKGKECNKNIWTYDKKGRTTACEYYMQGFIYRKDEYKYFKGGYSIKMILYDEYEKPRHKISPDSASYYPLSITSYKLDSKGREVEERVVDDRKKQMSRYTKSYNSEGKIVRDVYYDAEDKVVLTHVYVYK